MEFPGWYMQLKAFLLQDDNTAFLPFHSSFFKLDFRPEICDTFQFYWGICFPETTSTLRIDQINLVAQSTRGTCTEIHQHILLSSEEITDLLQAETTVLVKALQTRPAITLIM